MHLYFEKKFYVGSTLSELFNESRFVSKNVLRIDAARNNDRIRVGLVSRATALIIVDGRRRRRFQTPNLVSTDSVKFETELSVTELFKRKSQNDFIALRSLFNARRSEPRRTSGGNMIKIQISPSCPSSIHSPQFLSDSATICGILEGRKRTRDKFSSTF